MSKSINVTKDVTNPLTEIDLIEQSSSPISPTSQESLKAASTKGSDIVQSKNEDNDNDNNTTMVRYVIDVTDREGIKHKYDIPVSISLEEMAILNNNSNVTGIGTAANNNDNNNITQQMVVMQKVMATAAEDILASSEPKLKCVQCNDNAIVIFATVLNKIDENGHCQYLRGLNGTPICDEANCCENVMRRVNRKATAAVKKETICSPMYRSCSFCNKSMSLDDLKRCAKCRVMLYCSKDCQTQHWKSEHKLLCGIKESLQFP